MKRRPVIGRDCYTSSLVLVWNFQQKHQGIPVNHQLSDARYAANKEAAVRSAIKVSRFEALHKVPFLSDHARYSGVDSGWPDFQLFVAMGIVFESEFMAEKNVKKLLQVH